MQRRKIDYSDSRSALGGYNVGSYPLHHFICAPRIESRLEQPLHLSVVGDDEWIAGCYRYRRNSSVCSLEFVREGEMIFIQDGKRYQVDRDGLFIVRHGSDSEMFTASEYCRKKVMIISGPALPAMLTATGLSSVDVIRTGRPEYLEDLFNTAAEVAEKREEGFVAQCSTLIYRVMIELGSDVVRSGLPPLLFQAVSYMESRLDRQMSLDELCRQLHTSQPTLHRLFKQHLGKSPIEYFIRLKMDTARQLLELSGYSIKQISQRLGYTGQLYFSAEFRKRVGCSPRQYRAGALR